MSRGTGGRFEGGLRSADLRFAISDFCFGFDTPALVYDKGGGFMQSLRAFRWAGFFDAMARGLKQAGQM